MVVKSTVSASKRESSLAKERRTSGSLPAHTTALRHSRPIRNRARSLRSHPIPHSDTHFTSDTALRRSVHIRHRTQTLPLKHSHSMTAFQTSHMQTLSSIGAMPAPLAMSAPLIAVCRHRHWVGVSVSDPTHCGTEFVLGMVLTTLPTSPARLCEGIGLPRHPQPDHSDQSKRKPAARLPQNPRHNQRRRVRLLSESSCCVKRTQMNHHQPSTSRSQAS